jgi:hypothetical protein
MMILEEATWHPLDDECSTSHRDRLCVASKKTAMALPEARRLHSATTMAAFPKGSARPQPLREGAWSPPAKRATKECGLYGYNKKKRPLFQTKKREKRARVLPRRYGLFRYVALKWLSKKDFFWGDKKDLK